MTESTVHKLLDMLSVLIFTGVTYFALRHIATKFDTEGWVVAAVFIMAVGDKLGFRNLHKLVSRGNNEPDGKRID